MQRVRPYALLFLALTVIYHSNLRPIAAGDSLPSALIPFSVVLDHSITLDRFGPWLKEQPNPGLVRRAHGHWFSGYPIAGPVMIAPFYLPAAAIPAVWRLPLESLVTLARILEKFAAVALTAASTLGMLALLGRIAPFGWALTLTLLFALGTTTWSTSSQALWQQTFDTAAIVLCWYSLERWDSEKGASRWACCCGAAVGAALLFRLTSMVLIPAVCAAFWLRKARGSDYLRILLPTAAAAIAVLAYNGLVLGMWGGAYSFPQEVSMVRNLAGILFSPGRGLLIYTPAAIFALAAFLPRARESRARHLSLVTACTVFAALHIAGIARWPKWWGGYSWGPRLLTEIVPGLIVLIGIGVPAIRGNMRYAFGAVVVYCLFIQALGVYYYPKGHWDHLPVSVDQNTGRLWDWRDNPITRTLHAGPAWEPYVIVETAWKEGLPAAADRLRAYGISPY